MGSVREERANDLFNLRVERKEVLVRNKIASILRGSGIYDKNVIYDVSGVILSALAEKKSDVFDFISVLENSIAESDMEKVNKRAVYRQISGTIQQYREKKDLSAAADVLASFFGDELRNQVDKTIKNKQEKSPSNFRVKVTSDCDVCLAEAQNYILTGVFRRHRYCRCGWERV